MVGLKILLTGANGQLGQDFQKLFEKKEINYIPTDFGAQLEDLDITNLRTLNKFIRKNNISHLINCAAYNAVDQAETNFALANKINGEGVKNLAQVAEKYKIDLVHYSTDFVFDGKKGNSYFVDDIPNPISKYGSSKLLGEKYIQKYSKNFFLIRTSWVFGIGNINFVKKIIKWSENNSELRIVADQTSSPTYTVDLARATYNLMKTKMYGIYHITNSGSCSRYQWADYILRRINWKGKLFEVKSGEFKTAAERPIFSALDNSKFEEVTGCNLPYWEDATRRFLEELGY